MMKGSVVGTWRIVSTEVKSEDGQVTYPDGRSPQGYLIHTPEGYFSIAIMRSERRRYASDDFRGGTAEEKAMAAETFVSYSGTYSHGEGTVTHHIVTSRFSNWVGTDQQRFVEIDSGNLLLSTPPFLINGKEQKAYLV